MPCGTGHGKAQRGTVQALQRGTSQGRMRETLFQRRLGRSRAGSNSMTVTAIPLSRHSGAEIRGVDITRPLDAATTRQIYDYWLQHLILLFRGQELSQEQLIEATRIFGPMAKSNRKAEYCPP